MWLLWLLIVISGLFALGAVLGAPYVPTLTKSGNDLLDMADLKPGATIIDLGSGDGAFALQAARRGFNVIGYEINPILVLVARLRTRKYRKLVTIYLRDFWRIELPEVDAIYVFLIERYMKKLSDKLHQEIKKPTTVVSHVFKIPGKKPLKENQNTSVYLFGK
jgi:16S rRNA A1518/A1519 N6-dimethyltransferase RsmA/KsgA/DIM1 with predicted DNA glycosylase/AP lyase activity